MLISGPPHQRLQQPDHASKTKKRNLCTVERFPLFDIIMYHLSTPSNSHRQLSSPFNYNFHLEDDSPNPNNQPSTSANESSSHSSRRKTMLNVQAGDFYPTYVPLRSDHRLFASLRTNFLTIFEQKMSTQQLPPDRKLQGLLLVGLVQLNNMHTRIRRRLGPIGAPSLRITPQPSSERKRSLPR